MLIARAPLRICLGGGGTDLPFYYLEHTGILLTAAIDKYIYISLNYNLTNQTVLRTEDIESVDSIEKLNHGIVRETLNYFKVKEPLNITVSSSVPGGTGLGSSSSLTVALIKALIDLTHQRDKFGPHDIAQLAYHIERVILGEDGGKQDQFIASYGGIQEMVCEKDGTVTMKPIKLSGDVLNRLETNLAMFYIGMPRKSSDIQTKVSKEAKTSQLHFIKKLGLELKEALIKGEVDTVGPNWDKHWRVKKELSQNVSNNKIDDYYDFAMKNGATGGKLIGAGGGGFLIFYSPNPSVLIDAMEKKGLKYLKFSFNFTGPEILQKTD